MIVEHKGIQDRLKKIKVFILDMDGTIYLGNTLFPYTLDFLKRVLETKRCYYFFTNNSSKDKAIYMKKLADFHIHIKEQQMMISTQVILQYLKKQHPAQSVYIVGTPALRRAFYEAGWKWNEVDPDIVVVGFDTTLNYEKLEKACQFIRDGAYYYGVNEDLNCPMGEHAFIPDCGSIARLIEASTGRFPEFFGKPSKRALSYMIETVGCRSDELAIVGDRLYTDIAITKDSDVTSILVLSGEATRGDMDQSDVKPDIIVSNIGELASYL